MRLFTGLVATLFAAAFASTAAHAYTPESGIWWNPNESGTGVVIEVQDNLMVVAAYVGDAQGKSTWYTATAFLDGSALFNGSLDLTVGSQCPGCPYPGLPTVVPGAGSIRIVFDANDETKAALTWANGRTIPIERFEFYTRRPEDSSSVPTDITKMLGEWQWVTDFSSQGGNVFPFYGDVLVFGSCGLPIGQPCFSFNTPDQRWYYDGCRADDSEVAFCSSTALRDHDATGYYHAASDLQVIVVNDSATHYALYLAPIGTNDTNTPGAEITVYPKGGNPNNYAAFPARAFRTASRTFVEEEFGPSKQGAASVSANSAKRPGLSDMLATAGVSIEKTEKTAGSYDRAALLSGIEALEARLESRQQ